MTVELADHGERLIAFVLDLFIWLLLTLAIYIPIIWALGSSGGSLIAISIALFIGFLIRNLYFVTFELAWRGSTPGKRLVGLRVIDRAGGPLMPAAIIARNLTREVDVHSLGHADDLGKDRNGRRELGEPRGRGMAAVLRGAAVHQPRPHAPASVP